MWARSSQFRGVIGGAIIAVVVLSIAVVLLTNRGGAQTGSTSQTTAQATSTLAATDTPAATNTPAPTPTATHPPLPTPTATWAPFAGKIVRVVNSVPWLTGQVSVSCPAGTTLVGGGVDNGYGTTNLVTVMSSYPSSLNTWTVVGPMSNVSNTLSAVADCLQSATPVTTRIVKLTAATSSYMTGGGPVEVYDARCPSGVATGGGFDVNGGYIVDSHPDGANGWIASSARTGLTAYLICASAHIKVSMSKLTVTYPLQTNSGPTLVNQTAIYCPSGYLPLSGGFGEPQSSDIQIGWGTNKLSTSGQGWIVVGADKSGVPNYNIGNVYALCGQLA